MKTKIVAVALITITAGVFAFTRTKNAPPSDFRDAVAERSSEFNTDIPTFENNNKDISVPMPTAVSKKAYTWDNQTAGMTSNASKFFSVPDQLEKIHIINLTVDKLMLSTQRGQTENVVLVRTADTPRKVTLVMNGDIQIEIDFSNAERFRYARKAFAYYLFRERGGKYKLVPFTGASNEEITSSLTNSYNFKVKVKE